MRGFCINTRGSRLPFLKSQCPLEGYSTGGDTGIAMLYFAAETAVGEQTEERQMLSTERLALEMGLLNMNHAPLSSPEVPKAFADFESSVSSAGDTDSLADRFNNYFQCEDEVRKMFSSTFLQEKDLLRVLSFLPWRCVLQLRAVNKQFLRLSLTFVAVCRLPRCSKPALFIPCQEDLMANESRVEAELSHARGAFICQECGQSLNAGALSLKQCCQSSALGMRRLFVGQLRRDGTVPMIKWLLLTVFGLPPSSFISAENHRNKSSNHGKGCAWVVLQNNAASHVLSYDHRLFFDNVKGVEGVWLVPEEGKEQLAFVAQARGCAQDRSKHMPRNTLVVEVPHSAERQPPPAFRAPRRLLTAESYAPSLPSYVPPATYMESTKQLAQWHHDPYASHIVLRSFLHGK